MKEITWSIEQANEILSFARIRRHKKNVEVCVDGEWLELCRTDLKDNVATGSHEDLREDVENVRKKYLDKIRYGARKTYHCFAVIDSRTDG